MNQHDDLTDRLHRLAGEVQPPVVDPQADLRRGRTRLLWRRASVGGAALLTVGVIGGVALAGTGLSNAGREPGYAGNGGSPAPAPVASALPSAMPSAAPTPVPGSSPAAVPSDQPTPAVSEGVSAGASVAPTPGGSGPAAAEPATPAALRTWNDVLAEELDPGRAHLLPVTGRTANGQSSVRSDGSFEGLGSKYAWRNAGHPGLGMLQVFVAHSWNGIDHFDVGSNQGWPSHPATVAGGTRAQVWTSSDGAIQVVVQHADGQAVMLVADPLFGNNSTVAVSTMGLTEQQLLQAAADPRLTLPTSS